VWAGGLAINWHADGVLRALRSRDPKAPAAERYKIPHGGAFKLVSGANFFGEIVEWAGFALAAGSRPALAFAVFTACNIGPRAVQHHRWYLDKFKGEYPPHRKALIPFLL
jgi:steroid 5-alpha reductase family enzyme